MKNPYHSYLINGSFGWRNCAHSSTTFCDVHLKIYTPKESKYYDIYIIIGRVKDNRMSTNGRNHTLPVLTGTTGCSSRPSAAKGMVKKVTHSSKKLVGLKKKKPRKKKRRWTN